MMNDLERAAWNARKSANEHPPVMAAKAVVDQIVTGELQNIKHLIIVAVEDIDGADFIHILQAGSLGDLQAEGALMRAVRFSQNN